VATKRPERILKFQVDTWHVYGHSFTVRDGVAFGILFVAVVSLAGLVAVALDLGPDDAPVLSLLALGLLFLGSILIVRRWTNE
jgi:hypothetical protein